MQLLTEELRQKIPQLRAQEDKGGEAIAYIKFFTPCSNWSWHVTEFDGSDLFFGLVDGDVKELGYFRLSELKAATGPMGLPIERDRDWKPRPLKEIAPELFE